MAKRQKCITIKANAMAKSQETKKLITEKLIKAGYIVSDKIEHDTVMIISVGGDGSFLKTCRDFRFPRIPIFGVNTGHLGFFAEITPDRIDEFIEVLKKDKYVLQDMYLLKMTLCTKDSKIERYIINEAVIKGCRSRVVHLRMYLNEELMERFSGDGMLVATSTGSTAYNYSAGGSIVDNSLRLMQITPLSPINTSAYRSFTSSIIVPGNRSTVEIVPEYRFENSILIVTDGVEHRFKNIESMKFEISNRKIRLVRMPGYGFWHRVSEKFLLKD